MSTISPTVDCRILGDGALADELASALSGDFALERLAPDASTPDDSAPLIVAVDGWRDDLLAHWNDRAVDAGLPFLPIHIEIGRLVVGAMRRRAGDACWRCFAMRREIAHGDRPTLRRLVAQGQERGREREENGPRPNPWWTPAARAVVAALVRRRLRATRRVAPTGEASGTSPTTVYSLDLPSLRGREHPLVPDPLCPTCGSRDDDSADAAVVTPTRRPKPRPSASRLASLDSLRPLLEKYVLDADIGLVQDLTHVLLYDHVALATATMRVDRRDDHELGVGRTQRFDHSRAAALLEALERHAGHRARSRRTAVHATTADLGDDALRLPELGLHDDIAYEEFGDQLTPYAPDLPLDWVWGYSLTRRRPLLVPEHIAYYLGHTWRDLTRCVYEISNGCALGSCDEEAILHGLLEVAERDAFLLTWFRRRRPPRIEVSDLEGSGAPHLATKVRRLRAAGYRVHVFDTTTDLRIPAAMVVLEKQIPGVPQFLCTAGAGLRSADAVDAALDESAVCLSWRRRQSAADTERARVLLEDVRRVRAMKDHALLYTHPDAAAGLRFLLDEEHGDERPTLSLAALDARHAVPPSDDLRRDLETLLERVASRGLEVVTVDQSPPVLRDLGLACRKVLVPGTLTMTFGHALRRLRGLPRLLAPLGPDEPALEIDDINPWPHPFP